MVDFKAALQAGLVAHTDASAQRAQIWSVVEDLSRQVKDATNGVVGIELSDTTRGMIKQLASILAGSAETFTFGTLTARRLVEPTTQADLAGFDISPLGYPVTIKAAGEINIVNDRESLESALAAVLEHPDTGRKVQDLLDSKAQPNKPA